MQFLQLIGVLLIVNSFAVAGWLGSQGKLNAATSGMVIVAAVIGLALVFNERAVEVTFGKVASLKAAAQQATADASEIAAIRQRVEAQAATLDLVAKASADSRTLLDKLKDANEAADKKLKLIEDKTASIVQLPDGRIKMGALISGTPSLLQTKFDKMNELGTAKNWAEAFDAAKDATGTYEESTKDVGAAITVGGINQETVGVMYENACIIAAHFSKPEEELDWANKSLAASASPRRKACVVLALIHSKRQEDAQKLINDTMATPGPSADAFKAVLVEVGILRGP
jgi:hypothetical protein